MKIRYSLAVTKTGLQTIFKMCSVLLSVTENVSGTKMYQEKIHYYFCYLQKVVIVFPSIFYPLDSFQTNKTCLNVIFKRNFIFLSVVEKVEGVKMFPKSLHTFF